MDLTHIILAALLVIDGIALGYMVLKVHQTSRRISRNVDRD
jgi:hypothetical protein